MSSAIEVLKKDVASYESLKADNRIIKTLNNEEVCMTHYPQVKEAIVALEQKERLEKWLDNKEAKLKDIKEKGWSLEQLAGKQILINEIRKEVLELMK